MEIRKFVIWISVVLIGIGIFTAGYLLAKHDMQWQNDEAWANGFIFGNESCQQLNRESPQPSIYTELNQSNMEKLTGCNLSSDDPCTLVGHWVT